MDSPTEHATDRLMGWKEIGAYLDKSPRTVQRWERDLGLPVRRIQTDHEGQIVFALKADLDRWLLVRAQASLPTAPAQLDRDQEPLVPSAGAGPAAAASDQGRHRHWFAAATAVAIAAAGWVGWLAVGAPHRVPPASVPQHGLEHPVQYLLSTTGVFVFDEVAQRVVRHVGVPAYAEFTTLHGGRLSRDGQEIVFATRAPAGTVSLNLQNETWAPWIPTGGERLTSAAASPDGALAMTLDHDGIASVVDRRTRALLGQVVVPHFGFDIAPLGNHNHFVMAGRNDGVLTVVDGESRQLLTTIKAGASVGQFAISRDERHLYVTNHYNQAMSCIDLERGVVSGQATVGNMPFAVALATDERLVFVSNRDSDSVSVVATDTCTAVAEIQAVIGEGQLGSISIGLGGTRLYAISTSRGVMAVFDITDAPRTIIPRPRIELPRPMQGVVASPATMR